MMNTVKRHYLRLWKRHAFDLGVVCIAAVLGYALFILLGAVSIVSSQFAQFGLPSVDVILLIFPEDQTTAMAVGVAVGLIFVIGGYSEVSSIQALISMASVTLGLIVAMAGIVALLLPHYFMISTLNAPSNMHIKGGDSYRVNASMWILAASSLVVCSLLLKRRKVEAREVAPCLTVMIVMIVMGLVLSVSAVSWSLLRLLASSEVLLDVGLGGQKLPYITKKVLWAAPNSITGRALVTVGVGIVMWIGFAKKSFGAFPRYFTGLALIIFLVCCVILMFMVVPYYEAYADYVGALEN